MRTRGVGVYSSAYGDEKVEGIYVRIDGDDGFLKKRAKAVRSDFIQGIEEHYSKMEPVPNLISYG